jgi:hypothetical protein
LEKLTLRGPYGITDKAIARFPELFPSTASDHLLLFNVQRTFVDSCVRAFAIKLQI